MKKIMLHIKSFFFSVIAMFFVYFFFGTAVSWITYGDNSIASFSLRVICILAILGSGVFVYWAYHALRPDFD